MASTWSNLGIRLMATGENDGTWGAQTNDNWNRMEDASDGIATIAVSGAVSLTFTAEPTSYADENGRNKVLVFTGSAGSTQNITFPNIEKTYFVLNDSNSILTLKAGTAAQTVTLPAGKDMAIYVDGSDEVHNALANLQTTTLAASGNITASSSSGSQPFINIENTNNGATAGSLKFINDRGAAGVDGDLSGTITFFADDSDQNNQEFARIEGKAVDATSGSEEGGLDFYVAEVDGTVTKGMAIAGHASGDGDVTVDITTHDGSSGGLKLGGTLVTSTATELNLLDGQTALFTTGKAIAMAIVFG